MLFVTSTLPHRVGSPLQRATRQLARIVTNSVLAYAWGGLMMFVEIAIAERFDPDITGVLGLVGSWVWTMFFLVVGAPLVVLVLAFLDLGLHRVNDRHRTGLMISLLPGAVATIAAVAGIQELWLSAWLVPTGLAFGLTMRLPPRWSGT